MKKYCTILVVALALGLSLGGFSSVFGQEDDAFTLEEITVTAEKRSVNVQDTAMSVTAVAGQDIRNEAMNTLGDAMKNIPSVEVAASITGGQIYIRGIGAYGGEPSTAVMFDEVYSGRTQAVAGAMYDIERVEVLRGPQGTLYGRNATGGIVNVISKSPTDEFELVGNVQVGNYNLKHIDGAINIPLSESWAARVAVLQEERDGYLSCGAADSNKFAVRGKLQYKPNEKLTILGTFDYYWEKDHGNNTVPVPGSAGNLPPVGPPPSFGYYVPDANGDGVADDFGDPSQQAAPGPPGPGPPPVVSRDPDGIPDIMQTGWILPAGADEWANDQWHPAGSLDNIQKIYSLKIDLDLNWSQLTILPSYTDVYQLNVDNMLFGISNSATGTLGEGQGSDRQQYTGEVRLASPADSAFTWLVGYYGMKMPQEELNQQDPTTYNDNQWHFINDRDPDITHAFYGQATVPLTDWFRLTGGIRHSTDTNSSNYRYANSQVDPSHPLYDGDSLYDSGWLHYEQDVTSTTYKGGIELDIAENSMLYAQLATGFKQGGMNMTVPPSEYDPETLDAWEFGIKNRFMNGRMQLNLEGYYYSYDNMQAQFQGNVEIANTGQADMPMMIFNAGEGTNKGVDIEFDYLLTERNRVNLGVALMDAEYGELEIPPSPFYSLPFQLEGRQVAMSPDWAVSFGYEHTWLLDTGASVTGRIDTKISDGYYTTAEQYLPGNWQESYSKTNFNVVYNSSDGKWATSVWCRNLENDAQTKFIVPMYRRFVTDPRTYGVNVTFRY